MIYFITNQTLTVYYTRTEWPTGFYYTDLTSVHLVSRLSPFWQEMMSSSSSLTPKKGEISGKNKTES